jgi:chromosome segregation ATPase
MSAGTAKLFSELKAASVSKEEYRRVAGDAACLKLALGDARGRCEVLEAELAEEKQAKEEMLEHLDICIVERDMLGSMLEETISRTRLARDTLSYTSTEYPTSSADALPQDPTDVRLLSDLTLAHSDMATNHLRYQLSATTAELVATEKSLKETTTLLDSLRSVHSSLEKSHVHLQSLHTSLQEAHEPCEGRAAELGAEVERANQGEKEAEKGLECVKKEMSVLEGKMKGEREALKRANEGTLRWKSAEEALEEEIST